MRSKVLPFWLVLGSLLLSGCREGLRIEEIGWSADGKHLAFVSNGTLAFLEGAPPYSVIPYTVDGICSPAIAWSPLGGKLVATSNKKGSWDLLLCDVEEQEAVFLTEDIPKDYQPRFLNGEELLFFSERGGTPAPWRYLISSKQIVPFLPETEPAAAEGESLEEKPSVEFLKTKSGTEVRVRVGKKKWKWREPDLALDLPRWAPGKSLRCAFRARNPAIQQDDFIVIVDFEEKKSQWVPLLPAHPLAFADYLASRGKWEKALGHDQRFLQLYPDDIKGGAAYWRQALYHYRVKPDRARVLQALEVLVSRLPDSERALEAYRTLGLLAALEGDWQKAQAYFEKGSEAPWHLLLAAEKERAASGMRRFLEFCLDRQMGVPAEPRRELEAWDDLCRIAQSPEIREKARFMTAQIFEEKLRDDKKASQIYWKVNRPPRGEALERLFYLNRDRFFDFRMAAKIGETLIREFPDAPFWETVYDDQEQLKNILLRREDLKPWTAYFKARVLEREGKRESALKEYKKSGNREALFALGNLYRERFGDPAKSFETYLSYLKTFDSIPSQEEWERVWEKVPLPVGDLLMRGSPEMLKSLCQKFVKENPKNPYVPFVYSVLAMTGLAREDWPQAEKAARKFISGLPYFYERNKTILDMEKNEFEEFEDQILAIGAAACEQQQKWDEAMAFYDQLKSKDWSDFVQSRRETIPQYRTTEGMLFKDFLLAQTFSEEKFGFFVPTGREKAQKILKEWFPKVKDSPLKPLGYLLLCDLILEEAKNSPEKREGALLETGLICRKFQEEFPGLRWEGEGLIRLAAVEETDAFYQMALNRYADVAGRWSQEEVGAEALWHQARLYLNPLQKEEEGKQILSKLVETQPKSRWAARGMMELARRDSKEEARIAQAVALYRKVAQDFKGSEEAKTALRELGDLYFSVLKNKNEALKIYKSILEIEAEETELGEVKNRIAILEAGDKAFKLWLSVQDLNIQEPGEDGITLYEELLEQSKEEVFFAAVFESYVLYLKSARREKELVGLYRRRLERKMTSKEWQEMLEEINRIVDDKEAPSGEVKKFLNELAGSKKLSQKTLDGVQRARAKIYFNEEKYQESKKILEKLLRDHPKDKELARLYYQALSRIQS